MEFSTFSFSAESPASGTLTEAQEGSYKDTRIRQMNYNRMLEVTKEYVTNLRGQKVMEYKITKSKIFNQEC